MLDKIFFIFGLPPGGDAQRLKRAAHRSLLAAFIASMSASGCGGNGSGGSIVGQNPQVQATVTSATISPKTITRTVNQTVQYTVTGNLSTGVGPVDLTQFATFSSSNPNIVTINQSGLATAVLPGTATITATFNGGVTDTSTVTVNPFVNRLFVSNFGSNSTTVYDPAVGGDVAPLRSIAGALTTLDGPSQMAVSGQELFIANSGGVAGGNSTTVFDLHASGNVAPLRTIRGSNTLLNRPQGLAVANGELFVSNANTHSILVFPANGTGNIAPIRTISGPNTQLFFPAEISVSNGEILVTNQGLGQVLGFPVAANGNVAPSLRNLSGATSTLSDPFGILVTPNEIFVSNFTPVGRVLAFATNANGNATPPLRTIVVPAPSNPVGVAVLGSELFVADSATLDTAVRVFPTNQNSGAAPTREIKGPATLLNRPAGLLIAPSI